MSTIKQLGRIIIGAIVVLIFQMTSFSQQNQPLAPVPSYPAPPPILYAHFNGPGLTTLGSWVGMNDPNKAANKALVKTNISSLVLNTGTKITLPSCVDFAYDANFVIAFTLTPTSLPYELGAILDDQSYFGASIEVLSTINYPDGTSANKQDILTLRMTQNESVPTCVKRYPIHFYNRSNTPATITITAVNVIERGWYYPTGNVAIPQYIANMDLEVSCDMVAKKYDAKNINGAAIPLIYVDYVDFTSSCSISSMFENNEAAALKPTRLEWNYYSACLDPITNYHVQILKIYNTNPALGDNYTSDIADQTTGEIDWNKALNLYTGDSKKYLDVILSEGNGIYLWRVRPVGSFYPGGTSNPANYGEWNYIKNKGSYITYPHKNGDKLTINSKRYGLIMINGNDNNMNWTHERAVLQDTSGKDNMVDAISYYDNFLQTRQSQRRSSIFNTTTTSQIYYDHLGRAVINTLAVPIKDDSYPIGQHIPVGNETGLNYKRNLFSSPFLVTDYAFANSEANIAAKKDQGKLNYYYDGDDKSLDPNNKLTQPSNPNLAHHIPSAGGFPYVRMTYTNDGKNKVKETGGIGADLNEFQSSTRHTDRTAYSTPADQELIYVMGSEAPKSSSIVKSVQIDKDNVEKIAYVDGAGKPIATLYNNDRVNPTTNYLYPLTDSKSAGVTHKINGLKRIGMGYSFSGEKDIIFSGASTNMSYSIPPIYLPFSYCTINENFNLIAQIELSLTKLNTTSNVLQSQGATYSLTLSNAAQSSAKAINVEKSTQYKAERIITFSNIEDIKNLILSKITATLNNSVINAAVATLNTIAKSGNPGDLKAFYASLSSPTWIPDNSDPKKVKSFTYNIGCDDKITIPVLKCEGDCSELDNPNKFEAYLMSQVSTSLDGGNIKDPTTNNTSILNLGRLDSYFYRDINGDNNVKKLYSDNDAPYNTTSITGSNGRFNELISNMLASGYSLDKLCQNWQKSVQVFLGAGLKNIPKSKDKLIEPSFDLLNTFLNYVGITYKGPSNHKYDANGATTTVASCTNGVWSSAYGKGYLTFAHEYFYMNPNKKDPTLCLNSVGFTTSYITSSSVNLTELVNPSNSSKLNDFARCYFNVISQAKYDAEKKKWDDVAKTVEEKFKQSGIGSDWCNDPKDPDCLEKRQKVLVDACEKNCDQRDFELSVRKKFYESNYAVQGDIYYYGLGGTVQIKGWDIYGRPTDASGNVLTSNVLKTKDLNDYVSVINEQCKAHCHLTIYVEHPTSDKGIESVIKLGKKDYDSEDEWADYVKAMTYDYEIEIPLLLGNTLPPGGTNPEPWQNLYRMKFLRNSGYSNTAEINNLLSPYSSLTSSRFCPSMKVYNHFLIDYLNSGLDALKLKLPQNNYNQAWIYAAQNYRLQNANFLRDLSNAWDKLVPPYTMFGSNSLRLWFDRSYTCSTSTSNPVRQTASPGTRLPAISPTVNDWTCFKNIPFFHVDLNNNATRTIKNVDNKEWTFFPKPYWVQVNSFDKETPGKCKIYENIPVRFTDKFVMVPLADDYRLLWPKNYINPDTITNNNNNNNSSLFYSTANSYLRSGYLLQLNRHWTVPIYDGTPFSYNVGKMSLLPPDNKREITLLYSIFPPSLSGKTFVYFRWAKKDPASYVDDTAPKSCDQNSAEFVSASINAQISALANKRVREAMLKFDQVLETQMNNLDKVGGIDNYTYTDRIDYGNYTLYYYDRANRLVKTIPPKGITFSPLLTDRKTPIDHTMPTYSAYNSVNDVIETKCPDQDAEAHNYYDSYGRLIYTQNVYQFQNSLVTYIKYDQLNRIVETGEAYRANLSPAADLACTSPTLPSASDKKISYTEYSYALYNSLTVVLPTPFNTMAPHNIRNKLYKAVRHNEPKSLIRGVSTTYTNTDYINVETYYSYDLFNRAEWVITNVLTSQCNDYTTGTGIYNYNSLLSQFNADNPSNRITAPPMPLDQTHICYKVDYEYNQATGQVVGTKFNNEYTDMLAHKFTYDEEGKIITSNTSRNNIVWDQDYKYYYYYHGPLQRNEIGQDLLTANDYYYTINGALKGINDQDLENTTPTTPKGVYTDANGKASAPYQFAYALNYYKGDFDFVTGNLFSRGSLYNSTSNPNVTNYYGGNIASVETGFSPKIKALFTSNPTWIKGSYYKYDLANRLMAGDNNTYNSSAWTSVNNMKSNYTYDPNGNITTQNRANSSNLTYSYNTTNNRLQGTNGLSNLDYYSDGNLKYKITDNCSDIIWTYDGKIAKTSSYDIDYSSSQCSNQSLRSKYVLNPANIPDKYSTHKYYFYDAQGLRVGEYMESPELHLHAVIQKYVCNIEANAIYNAEGLGTKIYARGAGGKIIAAYKSIPAGDNYAVHPNVRFVLDYWPVYGSPGNDRIATLYPEVKYEREGLTNRSPLIDPKATGMQIPNYPTIKDISYGKKINDLDLGTKIVALKHFELKDWLGNVRVTFLDVKMPVVNAPFYLPTVSVDNYFPYGAAENDLCYSWDPIATSTAYAYFHGKFDNLNSLYPFGFDGMKREGKDFNAKRDIYNTAFREYDADLGRWWSLDPKPTASESWYAGMGNNPINGTDYDGLAWQPTKDSKTNQPTGYKWIPEENSYDKSSGKLLPGLFRQAIFFSENDGKHKFNPEDDYNMGSSTATVFKIDGTTEEFKANTYPSDLDKYATVPEGVYTAKVGIHNGSNGKSYEALKILGKVELGKVNPSKHKGETFADGIDIHLPGAKNKTGMTRKGSPISAGCLLIDQTQWSSFLGIFNSPSRRNDNISVTVSRSLNEPTNTNSGTNNTNSGTNNTDTKQITIPQLYIKTLPMPADATGTIKQIPHK